MGQQEETGPRVALSHGGCVCHWTPVNPLEVMNVPTPGTTLAAPGRSFQTWPGKPGWGELQNDTVAQLHIRPLSNKDLSRRGLAMGDFIGKWVLSARVRV